MYLDDPSGRYSGSLKSLRHRSSEIGTCSLCRHERRSRHENMSEAAATRRAELILNVRVPILKIRRAEIATAFDLGANTRGL
jgi:hypothetical protein